MNEIVIENSTQIILPAADIDELYTRWLAYIDRPKSEQTYRNGIKSFLTYLAEHEITQPTRADILSWRDDLKEKYRATTVQTYLCGVKPFFAWLADEGLYKDIAKGVHGLKLNRNHKKGYLSAEASRDVLVCIDTHTHRGKRDYAIMCLMLTTGLRTCEVVGANVSDLDIIGGQTVLHISGKGFDDNAAYVKIALPVEKAIRNYLQARGARHNEPLFTGAGNHTGENGRLTTRSIRRIVKERLRAAGFESETLTAHSLRHTAGTLALKNGGKIEQVQQMLRHSNVTTTMIYMHDIEREGNNSELNVARAILG